MPECTDPTVDPTNTTTPTAPTTDSWFESLDLKSVGIGAGAAVVVVAVVTGIGFGIKAIWNKCTKTKTDAPAIPIATVVNDDLV